MFDRIWKNLISDWLQKGAVLVAGYLVSVHALPTTSENNFVSAVLVIFSAGWGWWDAVGHQKLTDFLKSKGQNVKAIKAAPSAMTGVRSLIFIIGVPGLLALTLHAAKSQTICTGPYCASPYLGVGISESGGSFNVPALGLSGLADNNLNAFVEGGFDYFGNAAYLGINFLGEYGLIANGDLPGGGNSALWGAGQYVKLGYNAASAFGITVPTSNAPSLSGFIASTTPYVNLGIFERKWGDGFLAGVGVVGWLNKSVTVHIDWNYVNYNNANINPNVKEQSENMVLGGIDYHFPL